MCGCGISSPCFGGCPCGCSHTPPAGVIYYRDSRGFVGGPNPENHNPSARRVLVIEPSPEMEDQGGRVVAGWLREIAQADNRRGILAAVAHLAGQIEAQSILPEPTGLGAVVEDAEGNRWLIVGGPQEFADEWYSPDLNIRSPWPKIAAVRVLSEGVTP